MNKTIKTYAIFFGIILLVTVCLEINKTSIVDWRRNFNPKEKSPFGLYVFNQEANDLLNKKLKRINQSPYQFYKKDSVFSLHNILIIQKNLDSESWKKLLDQVKKGSDILLISDEQSFLDKTVNSQYFSDKETVTMKLTDRKFRQDSIYIDKLPLGNYFPEIEKGDRILGSVPVIYLQPSANFIHKKIGKGNIYWHADPMFLTNYYLLKNGNEKYLQDVFSYLPDRQTIWFMDDMSVSKYQESISILRFVLSKPSLRYAWWLFLGGLLLFVIFNVKRKQRIVPIIEPKKNKSVEFVRSIGNLYLNEGDFRDMMTKKAQYFLNRVRTELLIDTQVLDDNFIQKLHLKTGASTEKIVNAVELIKKAQDQYAFVTKEDLVKMNKILDEIF